MLIVVYLFNVWFYNLIFFVFGKWGRVVKALVFKKKEYKDRLVGECMNG